jgi:hypothetical protein
MLSRVRRALSSWAALPLFIVAVRTASLLACPASVEAPYLFLGLDVLTLLPLSIAVVMGRALGEGFGSVVLSAVCLGLPVAGLGWLAEKVAGRATSGLLGILCLLAIGVGFCLAAPMRGDRFMRVFITLLGVAALALGVKLLVEGHPGAAVIWIALPHVLAAVVALAWRPLASLRKPAVQAR